MSTVSAGSGGVSRAITNRPASRAFLIAGLTSGPDGVMRMPLSPFEIAFSMAATWLAVSPSSLPAADVSVMPSLSADSLAPLAIATKNGFVEVFVIRVTPIAPPAAEPAGAEPGAEPPEDEPAGAAL